MQITKRLLVMLLILSLSVSFIACGGGDSALDILESVPDLDTSKEESVDISEEDPAPAEGQTAMPKILQMYNSSQTKVVLAGTCEADATVSASFVGGEIATTKANGTVFALEVEVGTRQDAHIQVTATAEGKKESDPKLVIGGYHPTTDGNLVYPTVLADNATLFLQSSLDTLSENSVCSNSAASDFTSKIDGYIKTLQNSGDTELIYVLLPGKAAVMGDAVPEGTDISESITLYTQAKAAIEASDATLIDMKEVFAAADTSKYPLFYRTHGTMSEYAAYLTYKTLMDYIATKYPSAAPRSEEEFDIKEIKDALGGDLAYHFGLDTEVFTETVYDFVPKFDTKLGDQIPEEFEDKYLISEIRQYMGENDYRFYNSYFTGKELNIDPTITRADQSFGFFTGRADLPTALIYRDEATTPMVDMLAERFNNSLFETSGQLSVNASKAVEYAGEGKKNVDYIIVLLSEENMPKLITND